MYLGGHGWWPGLICGVEFKQSKKNSSIIAHFDFPSENSFCSISLKKRNVIGFIEGFSDPHVLEACRRNSTSPLFQHDLFYCLKIAFTPTYVPLFSQSNILSVTSSSLASARAPKVAVRVKGTRYYAGRVMPNLTCCDMVSILNSPPSSSENNQEEEGGKGGEF